MPRAQTSPTASSRTGNAAIVMSVGGDKVESPLDDKVIAAVNRILSAKGAECDSLGQRPR